MKIDPFKLEEYYAKYEFTTKYMLSSSDCESFSINEILKMSPGSEEEFKKQWLGYTEAPGSTALREEVCKLYSSIEPQDILVHTGAEEAIFNFMNSALEAGDHVIVQFPAYQSLYQIAQSIGCDVTLWQMQEDQAWELDVDFLKDKIQDNTKAIIINCPHNPTGYQMSNEKLQSIVDIAREKDIYIFSDEVYRYLEYNPAHRLEPACDLYEKAVSLGVISKAFGLAGLRIGWAVTRDKEILEKMSSFKHYTTICNSAPSEFLTTIALQNKEKILKRNLDIIQNNLSLLDILFKKYRDVLSWHRPKAGGIAFPKIQGLDSEEFCADLIKEKGVLLLPSRYYNSGNSNFRIGFSRKNMPEALRHLDQYLQEKMVAEGRLELPTCGL